MASDKCRNEASNDDVGQADNYVEYTYCRLMRLSQSQSPRANHLFPGDDTRAASGPPSNVAAARGWAGTVRFVIGKQELEIN